MATVDPAAEVNVAIIAPDPATSTPGASTLTSLDPIDPVRLSVPPETVIGAENVLLPESDRVPSPCFTSAPGPLMWPPKVPETPVRGATRRTDPLPEIR